MKAKKQLKTESGAIDPRTWKWPLKDGRATRRTFIAIIVDRAKVSIPEAEAEFERALKSGEVRHVSNVGLDKGVKAYKIIKQ